MADVTEGAEATEPVAAARRARAADDEVDHDERRAAMDTDRRQAVSFVPGLEALGVTTQW